MGRVILDVGLPLETVLDLVFTGGCGSVCVLVAFLNLFFLCCASLVLVDDYRLLSGRGIDNELMLLA